MWRIANCVYRAFRNTATHRCSQDVLIPLTTTHNKDDDSNREEYEISYFIHYSFNKNFFFRKEKCSINTKWDIHHVLKNNQFPYKNIEKLQECLRHIPIQQVRYKFIL
jgi:hypothetical protein